MTQEPGHWQRRVFQLVMPIEGITLALLLVSSPVGVPIGAAIVYVVLVGAALLLGLVGSLIGCYGRPRPTWALPSLLLHVALLGTVTLWRPVVAMMYGLEEAQRYGKVQDQKQQEKLRGELLRLASSYDLSAARSFLEKHDELRVGYGPALQAILCNPGGDAPDPQLLALIQRRDAPRGGDLLLEAAQCRLPAFLAVARALALAPVTLAQNGRSPLTKATDLELLRYLLAQGVDVNARDKQGATPLMYHRNREVTRFLLEHGADAKAKDAQGRSALHQRAPDSEAAAIYTLLLDAGADVNLEDAEGTTPLLAMRRLDTDSPWIQAAADVLVAHGARSQDRVQVFRSLLNYNELEGRPIPLEPLLQWGGLDLEGHGGAELLLWSLISKRFDVVERLLALGANPLATTDDGTYALRYYESTFGISDPPTDIHVALRQAAARFASDAGVRDAGD